MEQEVNNRELVGQLEAIHKAEAFGLFCIMCCIYVFAFICDSYELYFYYLGFHTLGLVS